MGLERAAGALPRAVPGTARWAIAAIFAVDGAMVGTWAARVPALQERAGVSTATLGLALAGLAAGALVAMPISGWRTARVGSRRTTLVCATALVFALPIPALATSAAGLILGAVALGAANGGIERSTRGATESLHRVVIRFAGDSGDGMQLTGDRFTTVTAMFGNDLSTLPDFPAEIRAPAGTVYGVSSFQVHISDHASPRRVTRRTCWSR